MDNSKAKEIIKEYVFEDYNVESLYKFLDKDLKQCEKHALAEGLLTKALQKACIALNKDLN